jgi:hypothetical protein
MDQECMVLIKGCNVRFQAVHKKVAKLIIGSIFREQTVPKKDSPGKGVHNKRWFVSGI